jgi:hypothetical protein
MTSQRLSMRQRTISRSRYLPAATTALLTATLVAGSGVVVAQEPQPQQRAVHVVSTGETLWSLAQRYFGDPLLWPEIYRLNTLVVEDPHWIFPGEELRLQALPPVAMDTTGVPADEQAVVGIRPPPPTPAPPPPSTGAAPSVFARDTRGADRYITNIRGDAYRYKPLRRGEFYAAGFLTEEEPLPWAEVRGAVERPRLRNLRGSSTAQSHEQIGVVAPRGATYQVGDSLLVARIGREVPGWGRVVTPNGIARVSEVAGRQLRAEIVSLYGRVSDGQFALPVEPFRDPGNVVPVPVENGAMGQVITRRDPNPIPGQQDIVFIDLGRADGVVPGDVFEVLEARAQDDPFVDSPWRQLGIMHVVFVRERSASAILTHINEIGIDAGAPVRLIMKMPS